MSGFHGARCHFPAKQLAVTDQIVQGAWPGWVRLGWVWRGLAGSGRGEGAASAAAFRFCHPEPHSG
jgi:hypothetical protein